MDLPHRILLVLAATTIGCTDSGSSSLADAGAPDAHPTIECVPPPLLNLDDIPDNPALDDGQDDTVAIFEVDGHNLIGKHVTDRAAAEGGLKLWQEFTLRIPESQLQDLVQLEISTQTDPSAYFHRGGDVQTERLGLMIGFGTVNFDLNDPDPCAPLIPRRGNFDWTLIHEFGHLHGFLDGAWPDFLRTFADVRGDGEGYPEDGSPVLDRDFVTSYAERDDGDEDYAETFTTFVMLDESEIPELQANEPLALAKVRWVAGRPGMRELRQALRIGEPHGGSATPIAPLARLFDVYPLFSGPLPRGPLNVPSWLHGTWEESATEGFSFTFTADDIVSRRREGGVVVEEQSVKERLANDEYVLWKLVELNDSVLQYVSRDTSDVLIGDNFSFVDGHLLFARDQIEGVDHILEKVP